MIFVWLYRLIPKILDALAIIRPETIIRLHRRGFRAYWRWKSRSLGGRPKLALEIRLLIREMSEANPLWGAPRIHGALLKLGIDLGQTTVAKYMVRNRRPPSQRQMLPETLGRGFPSDTEMNDHIFHSLASCLPDPRELQTIRWIGCLESELPEETPFSS